MKRAICFGFILCLIAGAARAGQLDFYQEGFPDGLPGNWAITDDSGSAGGKWVDFNPCAQEDCSHLQSPFLIADSRCFRSTIFDTSLVSGRIDCSDFNNIKVKFGTHFQKKDSDEVFVYLSNDDGDTWTEVLHYTKNEHKWVEIKDFSSLIEGYAEVRIKFRYTTNGGVDQKWWAIDNLSFIGEPTCEDLWLTPETVAKVDQPGRLVTYSLTLCNGTNATKYPVVTLSYTGNQWPVEGPESIEIDQGDCAGFSVVVQIPADALNEESDTVTVGAELGGFTDESNLTTQAAFQWKSESPTLQACMDHGLASDGAALYKIGGSAQFEGSDALERYDPESGIWEYRSNVPYTLENTVAAEYLAGKIYVIAGSVDGSATPDPKVFTFMAYDVEADSWEDTLAPVPGVGTWGASLVAADGLLYKLGGGQNPDEAADTLHVYDPDTDAWTELSAMLTPRQLFCAYAHDQKIYVVGGYGPSDVLADGEIYDIQTDIWAADTESLPAARAGGACIQVFDGEVLLYVAGAAQDYAIADSMYYRDLRSKGVGWTSGMFGVQIGVFRAAGGSIGQIAFTVNGTVTMPDIAKGFDAEYLPIYTVQTYGCWDLSQVCYIGGVYYDQWQINPENSCEICNFVESYTEWTPLDGDPCDDGLYCNGEDTCAQGACAVHTGDPCIDDGLWCNGSEICDEDADACGGEFGEGERCPDDGLWCNGIESCDEDTDACQSQFGEGERCPDDGLFCNGPELCDEQADACAHDGDPCDDWEECNEDSDECELSLDDDDSDDDSDDDDSDSDEGDDDDDAGCGC